MKRNRVMTLLITLELSSRKEGKKKERKNKATAYVGEKSKFQTQIEHTTGQKNRNIKDGILVQIFII